MKRDSNILQYLALLVVAVGVFALGPQQMARAQYIGGGSIGAAGGGGFSGGTISSTLTFSGVASDVATGASEDFTVAPGGSVVLRSGDNVVDIQKSDGTVMGRIATNTGSSFIGLAAASATAGYVQANPNGGIVGRQGDQSASTAVATFADNMTDISGGTPQVSVYGEGAIGVIRQQSLTISTGTSTASPTSSQVELSCTTAPCDWQPGEASVVDGWRIDACNVDAADSITITDNTGGTATVRTRGGTTITLSPNGDCATCTYSGSIWGCR